MSQADDLSDLEEQLLRQWPARLVENYVLLSAVVLTLYEYCITLEREVLEIWTGRVTITKALFLLNRYSFLIYQVCNLLRYFLGEPNGCNVLDHLINTLFIFPAIAITCIFTLRTFAIYEKSWLVLFLLSVPGLGLIVTNAWFGIFSSSAALPRQLRSGSDYCTSTYTSDYFRWELSNWAFGTCFDALVVLLTFLKTLGSAVLAMKLTVKNHLCFLLLRDGIMYYSVIFLPEIVQVILYARSLNTNNETLTFLIRDLTSIIQVLQVSMTNRLILNLSHAAHHSNEDDTYQSTPRLPEPVFAYNPILGNIGAPVRMSTSVGIASPNIEMVGNGIAMPEENDDVDVFSYESRV